MKGNDNDMNNISYNESFERNDEFGIINMIIDKLPPLQSEILKMKEIDGYEAEEIMEITGCTYDSLRQNLSRARRKIRDEYLRISKIKVK
jgi:RNA polymerase sigma-70 factor (ECF subfamily)